MEQLFNQFSYPLLSALFIVLFSALLYVLAARTQSVSARSAIAINGIVIAAVIVGYFALRPGQSDVRNLGEAEAILNNGQPSFVEFFSNYCTSCLLIRPTVDQKITEIRDDFNILRVDIHTDFGRALRERYGFTYTPEFLLIDANGEVKWRGNSLPDDDTFDLVLNAPD